MKTLLADDVNDGERQKGTWAVETKAVKGLGVLFELCSAAVVHISKGLDDVCVEPVSSYC